MAKKARIDSAESLKDSSDYAESAKDSNNVDCYESQSDFRNDDSMAIPRKVESLSYRLCEGAKQPKQTINPHEAQSNLAPLHSVKKSDYVNANNLAESRRSERVESLNNSNDSIDSSDSKTTIDCHDSATQNLAMTTKDTSTDSSDSIESNDKIDCHANTRRLSRNDGAGIIPRNAESRNDDSMAIPRKEQNLVIKARDDSAESTAKSHNDEDSAKEPRFRSIIIGANGLSLGISIVVAILLGIGAGILMQKIFGVFWVLFLGVLWGILAAILNVYKVYKAELRDFEKLAENPKYAKRQN